MREDFKVTVYDTIEDGHPIQKVAFEHAEVLSGSFRDFVGTVNAKGTLIRSFCVSIPNDQVQYLKDNDIPVSDWAPKEDPEAVPIYLVKIKINFSYYKAPVITTREGDDGEAVLCREEAIHLLQRTIFTDCNFTARITHGVYLNKPYTNLYLDRAAFTKMKNEPNPIEKEMFGGFSVGFEEEVPFN